MRFNAKFTHIEFDPKTFKTSWDEAMATQMRQAARAWLNAILTAELPVVRRGRGLSKGIPPVWTGTARGSFIPLGRFLRIAIPIRPIKVLSGRGPTVGSNRSKFEFTNSGGTYSFRFSTSLVYFMLNDFYESDLPLTHKTPWGGMKIGQKAFKAYVDGLMAERMSKVLYKNIRYTTRVTK